MTPPRVLQALLTPVAGVAALLVLMAPAATDHSPPVSHLPRPAPAPKPVYGVTAAPAAAQIHVRLKRALRSGLVFDVRTGRVLWARRPDRELAIASLTKMMTALVVVHNAKASDRVLITADALHYTGSGVGELPRGKRVPLTTLLYGLLLPSGNDAAIALADDVAGSQARFVAEMNATAGRMGLTCTHFTSVSGIVDRGNHSCAVDLAVLAHAVLRDRLLARIVATRSVILPFPIKGGKLYLYTNNPLLLARYPGTDGVKTGFTDASGRCLVATVRRGRRWIGVVLLHSADPIDQALTLFGAAFASGA